MNFGSSWAQVCRIVVAGSLGALSMSPHAEAQGKVISVDCDKGGSVSKALEDKTSPLTVQIKGICHEDVTLSRSDVTLRGTDPLLDGLRGLRQPPDPGGDWAVMRISDASRVRLENLSFQDGIRFGLLVRDGNVTVVNCRMSNNGRAGAVLADGGTLDMTDTEISGTGRGLQVFEAGLAFCHHCTITVTSSVCALLVQAGVLGVDSASSITANFCGIAAFHHASVGFDDSTVTATRAVYAESDSIIRIGTSTVDGAIQALTQTHVSLDASSQSGIGVGQNFVDASSALQLAGSSTLLGPVDVSRFSTLTLESGSLIDGDLSCSAGGNAHCDDPAGVSGATNGCALCVKP